MHCLVFSTVYREKEKKDREKRKSGKIYSNNVTFHNMFVSFISDTSVLQTYRAAFAQLDWPEAPTDSREFPRPVFQRKQILTEPEDLTY